MIIIIMQDVKVHKYLIKNVLTDPQQKYRCIRSQGLSSLTVYCSTYTYK